MIQSLLKTSVEQSPFDLKIMVRSKPNWEECNFWVVFYPKGKIPSNDVVRAKTFSSIFENAISQGINDNRRLMYVDSSFHKHKCLYLLFYPENLYYASTNQIWDTWLEDFIKFLRSSTHPNTLGLYFGEKMFSDQNMKDQLVRCIDRLMTEEFPLESITLLTIFSPHKHLLESAKYVQKCLQGQYNIEVSAL